MNKRLLLTFVSSFSILSMTQNVFVHGMEVYTKSDDISRQQIEMRLQENEEKRKQDRLKKMKETKVLEQMMQNLEQTNECQQSEKSKQILEELKEIIPSQLDTLNSILKNENTIVKINPDPEEKLYIIGDIHGSKETLISLNRFIKQHAGTYVFLGDYVDRGNYGAEVFTLLANLKAKNPNKIYLLRGNHELESVNKDEFYFELNKFNGSRNTLYDHFKKTFEKLPLAAVINHGTKKIFCVHGGICPINSNSEDPLVLDDIENLKKLHSKLFKDIRENLLWSDPDPNYTGGFVENGYRSIGYVFGEKATKEFLDKNGLDFIVRAHEFIEEGFKENFGGLVKTVFSSLNYGDEEENTAVILEIDSDGKHQTIDIKLV